MNSKFLASRYSSKPRMFIFMLSKGCLSFLSDETCYEFVRPVLVCTFQYEASFTIPSIAVAGSIFVMPCFVKNFLAVYPTYTPPPPPCIDLHHLGDIYRTVLTSVEPESDSLYDCGCPMYVLILKGTKYQLSVYEKWQFCTVSLRSVLHFSSVSAQFQMDSLKNKINRMHNVAHTNKYR